MKYLAHRISTLISVIAFFSLLPGSTILAAGKAGKDVQIECPCSVSAVSASSGTVTLGVNNIGTSAATGLFIQLYAHTTTNNDVNTAEFLGAVDIGDVAAGSTLASQAFNIDLQGPSSGTYFITAEILDGESNFIDDIRMIDQVTLGGSFSVTGIDMLLDTDNDGVGDYNESLEGTDASSADSKPGESTIDVLIVYDQTVVSEYNGDHQARIDHIITVSNTALSDSSVPVVLRQVKSTQIDSSAGIEAILESAEKLEAPYTSLGTLREENGADLIALVTAGDQSTCGLAGMGGDGREGFMNASTYISSSSTLFDGCDDMTVLHEIGHNMGLGHSAAQDEVGTFIWSRGYGETDRFHTIMAYDTAFGNEPQLMQVLSNPDISTCLNSACGRAIDGSDPASAARSMDVVRFQVARYQPTVVSGSGGTSSGGSSSGGTSSSDSDGDGIPDIFESILGSDPAVADAGGDVDSDGLTNQQEFDSLPDATQYLQTTSASANISRIHIINTSEGSQQFTGTLYDGDGTRQGAANLKLSENAVAANGRLILTSGDLETIFGVSAWKGPAMLEVKGSQAFELMAKLISPSGLTSNTNCVRQDRVLNIEGFDSENRTFVRFINTTSSALGAVTGTLYDVDGQVIGTANTTLLDSLAAKAQVWINRDQFAEKTGSEWDGEAMLEVSDIEGLELLNLNFVNNETFFNFSCFESSVSGGVYLQTTSTSANVSLTHIVNTSATAQQFTGTLYNGDGQQLGNAGLSLHAGSIPSKGRAIVSSTDLEEVFGASAWKGPAVVEISGSSDFEVMTKLKSPSGLISNTNCVRSDQVHNIEGVDSSDMTFVRFINTGNSTMTNIRATLFNSSGNVIGDANQVFVTSLGPKAQVWVNRDNIIDIVGDNWNGEAMLEVAQTPDLKLLNLNFVNSETFFNFSCYESSVSN